MSFGCSFKNSPVLLAERIILILESCIFFGNPVEPEVCNSTVELVLVHSFKKLKRLELLSVEEDKRDDNWWETPFNIITLLYISALIIALFFYVFQTMKDPSCYRKSILNVLFR